MKRIELWTSALLIALATAAWAQTPETPAEPAGADDSAKKGKEVDPAEWVPADALAYIGVTDMQRTWEDFKNTASYKLMNDKEAQKLPSATLFSGLEKFQEHLATLLETKVDELKNPFGGALAVYVAVPKGGKWEEAQPSLTAAITDREALAKYYEAIVNKLKASAKHTTENVEGGTIDIFTPGEGDAAASEKKDDEFENFDENGGMPGDPTQMIDKLFEDAFKPENLPKSLAICMTQDRFFVGHDADAIKAALKREGGSDTLAGTDDHKALRRHLKPLGTVHLLVNLPQIIELAKSSADGGDADELRDRMKLFGAEGLRSLVGHLRVGASAYDSKMELLFLMSGERSGLAQVLSMDNRSITPPRTASADTTLYAAVNLNVPQLVDNIERMVRQSDPSAADEMRTSMEQIPMGDKTINLREELLQHLVGPLSFSLAFNRPIGPDATRMLVRLGQKDQAAVLRFLSAMAPMLTERDLRGTKVYEPVMPIPACVTATSDQLLIGNTPAVEAALEAGDAAAPLSETDAWRRVARHVPEEAWLVFYMDSRKLFEAALDYYDKRDSVPPTDVGMMMAGGLTAGLDESGVQTMRKVLKYQGVGVVTVATTKEGVRVTAVNLKPGSE